MSLEEGHTLILNGRHEALFRIIPDKQFCDPGNCLCSKLLSLALFLKNCFPAWLMLLGMLPPTVLILSSFQDPSHSACQPSWASPPQKEVWGQWHFQWHLVSMSEFLLDSAGSRTPSLVVCVSLQSCCHKVPQIGWLEQKMVIVLVLEKSKIKVSSGLVPPEGCEESVLCLSLVCASGSEFSLFIRPQSCWNGAHPNDLILTWSSAKTWFPNKVTITGTSVWTSTSFGHNLPPDIVFLEGTPVTGRENRANVSG